jgi:glucan phosphoethanolaminetransferase (alkaline phosphatase superfamily)
MFDMSPKAIIVLGFLLVLLGFVLPFLMMIGEITTTFFLALISYLASFIGMVLGIIGIAFYVREKDRDEEDYY